MEKLTLINYKKIYSDILERKFPDKEQECLHILNKKASLSAMDVISLNQIIFGLADKKTEVFNQKHRSYKTSDILKILDYQKKHKLNNTQLANQFKLSRNTITKWKKYFRPDKNSG